MVTQDLLLWLNGRTIHMHVRSRLVEDWIAWLLSHSIQIRKVRHVWESLVLWRPNVRNINNLSPHRVTLIPKPSRNVTSVARRHPLSALPRLRDELQRYVFDQAMVSHFSIRGDKNSWPSIHAANLAWLALIGTLHEEWRLVYAWFLMKYLGCVKATLRGETWVSHVPCTILCLLVSNSCGLKRRRNELNRALVLAILDQIRVCWLRHWQHLSLRLVHGLRHVKIENTWWLHEQWLLSRFWLVVKNYLNYIN